MPRRTRVPLLVAAAIAVAGLVTCGLDDAPLSPPAHAPTDLAAARSPRKRVVRAEAARAPSVDAAIPPHLNGDAPALWTPQLEVPAERPPATGRVRVLLLKDGLPFAGGHVCFMPEEKFIEPRPWDGVRSSDGAYFSVPYYTAFWPWYDPVLGSADGDPHFEERSRGVTGPDGVVTLDVRAGLSLVPYVRYGGGGGFPLTSQTRVNVVDGGDATLTIEAAPMRTVTGRCIESAGQPLAGIWVQAIAPREERPLSRRAETSAAGAFQLAVYGRDADVRVRAIVPYGAHPLGIYDAESEVPPIPAETTLAGVVPGGEPVDVRMPPAALAFIELTVAEGEQPLDHLQIEGLVFDPRAAAWGRLGGPQYKRAEGKPGGRRAVIALPRADVVRPLMLWSWGWTITAVDPRGADHVAVEIPRGRRAGVRGRGWRDGDRLRVVGFLGPAGQEFPCIWIDGVVGKVDRWSRDDSPISAIEFQVVRDGVVAGRSACVPPGTGPAAEVAIDLE